MIDKHEALAGGTTSCMPKTLIVGIVAPLLIFLVLFFWAPGLVQKKEGEKSRRDGKKVFGWTVGLTLLVWAGLCGYSQYYSGNLNLVCST